MEQRKIGIIIIIFSVVLALFVYSAYAKEDKYINQVIGQSGSCYLEDGTCLHEEKDNSLYILGWTLSATLLLFGAYLAFIDKTQEKLYEHQTKVSKALEKVSKKESFEAFLEAFDEAEQNVLKAIHNQEGIKQSTLRYKTDISKTALSLMLKDLENKGIIARKPKGKTKLVFLKKKF